MYCKHERNGRMCSKGRDQHCSHCFQVLCKHNQKKTLRGVGNGIGLALSWGRLRHLTERSQASCNCYVDYVAVSVLCAVLCAVRHSLPIQLQLPIATLPLRCETLTMWECKYSLFLIIDQLTSPVRERELWGTACERETREWHNIGTTLAQDWVLGDVVST